MFLNLNVFRSSLLMMHWTYESSHNTIVLTAFMNKKYSMGEGGLSALSRPEEALALVLLSIGSKTLFLIFIAHLWCKLDNWTCLEFSNVSSMDSLLTWRKWTIRVEGFKPRYVPKYTFLDA